MVCRCFLGWSASSRGAATPRAASRERDTRKVHRHCFLTPWGIVGAPLLRALSALQKATETCTDCFLSQRGGQTGASGACLLPLLGVLLRQRMPTATHLTPGANRRRWRPFAPCFGRGSSVRALGCLASCLQRGAAAAARFLSRGCRAAAACRPSAEACLCRRCRSGHLLYKVTQYKEDF